jgi:bifunctional ADP-heptose synthase (sugar kinase/adenylyltransferase)
MTFKQSLRIAARRVAPAAAVAASVVTSAAHAAGTAVDVTDTVATVGAQLVPIGLVGVAVLGVIVAVKAFKWVRGALS